MSSVSNCKAEYPKTYIRKNTNVQHWAPSATGCLIDGFKRHSRQLRKSFIFAIILFETDTVHSECSNDRNSIISNRTKTNVWLSQLFANLN